MKMPLAFSMVVAVISCILFVYHSAQAEIKIFEKEVVEVVASDQSREQIEAFALQKAKRLAVEEAGTYISSLTIVQNYQLAKDEVTALASGVVQAKIVGGTSFDVKNGNLYVRVRSVIQVDTSILDRQIQEIMKEKDTLKKLEEERKKNKNLEEKLASLKASEVKRLDELNAQALALERERDRQRLFREEQALKARGELSRAEAGRLAKEREMQARINKTLADQEKAKREEVVALAREQDNIRRAQLENEQRWNELARKAQLAQEQWVPIDDSLSFKQASDETNVLKQEIANLRKRLTFQYRENRKNLETAYNTQISMTKPKLPSPPAAKDPFDTTAEYNKRLADHKAKVSAANRDNDVIIRKIKAEENLSLAESEMNYLSQQIRIMEPFIKRIQALQTRRFFIKEASIAVELGEPDADNNRFPLTLQYQGKKWSLWWNYSDRKLARDFYNTRAYLKAEGIFQLEGNEVSGGKLTDTKVFHPATGEAKEFHLENVAVFNEISQFEEMRTQAKQAVETGREAATVHLALSGIDLVLVKGGCFSMGDTFDGGKADEKPVHEVCVNDFYLVLPEKFTTY